MVGEDELHDDNPPPPLPVPLTQQTPYTLSTIKLHILKKEGLHKDYDRFQSLLSQLEIHGAGVSTEDANQKFLRVFESNVKGSTASSSSTHNVAFVSSESTSNINDVSTAYGVSTSFGHNTQREGSSSYTDELTYSFFNNQSSGPQLDHEDLEQVDEFDLEEMDLKWQVAMISIRLKKFYKKTRRKLHFDSKEPVGFDKTYRNIRYKVKDNERRPRKQEEPKALVTLNGDGVDWIGHAEDEQENFALMAYSNSGSDTEVTSCSKEYVESYAKLKKLYDEQREQLGDASIEILAYTQALKKVEAQLVCNQKNQHIYKEKIRFMKIDLDDKTNVLAYHKKLLAEAVKEKEELKTKLENFQSSSKSLSKLLNSQMSARDKSGLGYGNQIHEGVLSYENEVLESVFNSRPSDVEDSPVNDGFANVEGIYAVPPPMTGIYMPSKFDFGIDESYVETPESMPTPAVNEPKAVSKPKFLSDVPIIKEYESDSDAEYVIKPSKEQEKPSCAFINTGKATGQRENRPMWNNVQRLNHQNKFVPKEVLTKTGIFPINAARQNLSSQAAATSTARKVNTARPIANEIRPRNNFYNSHSPIRRLSNRTIAPKANFTSHIVNIDWDKTVSAIGGNRETAVKTSAGCNWRPKRHYWNKVSKYNSGSNFSKNVNFKDPLGRPKHMTGNKACLVEYQDYNGGPIAFGGSKGQITGKDSKCLVLSPDFKLPDENQVLLRVPRQNNMYSFNLENIVPTRGLACLIAKATDDESNKWHRRLGHVNFKNLNKLVKGNLVRGLPSKIFQNDHTCVACQKGKQHKASLKAKVVSSISQSLQLLHMDLFGPTSIRSINHKTYCLVITDDFSRFSYVFFLRTKDETSGILKDFIRKIENQLNQKVKTIRCDNGTEFKNRNIIELCGSKGIKKEYSNAKTPQQNGVAERKNKTLIEAARTMLADSFLPNTFWAEVVSTACYVLNRVLVTKPQNKTPYELITGKMPIISYIRPFRCHVTILNIIGHLGKFEEKSDEGFLVGYSLNSKAFRVYNLETKRVEENLHINFLKNKPNVVGPKEVNHSTGTQDNIDAGNSEMEAEPAQEYFVLPLWSSYTSLVKSSKAKNRDEKTNRDTGPKTNEEPKDQDDQAFLEELERLKRQEKEANDAAEAFRKKFAQCTKDLLLQAGATRATSTNTINTISTPISTASPSRVFSAKADFTNLETTVNVSHVPTSRIHSIHPTTQILRDPTSAVQTKSKVNKSSRAHAFIEPKKISQALEDEIWVDAIQEELLQFKIQKVSILVDLPFRKREIRTKWVYRNKKDERGVVVRNKARIEAIMIFLAFASYMGFIVYQMDVKSAFLYGTIDEEVYVSQPPGFVDPKFPKKVYKVVKALYGLHQAPRAWYATLSTFLLKSGYRRGTIDKTLFIKKDKNDIMLVQVYVDDIIFGSTKKSWCDDFEALMKSRFQMSSMGELTFFLGLQVKQKEDGIFISQDKYVAEILKKFDFASVKIASTPIETQKPLTKDEEAADVDVHLYRSMIGSLMYLTASRPDIMFAVCACSRFQVTPKTSHLHAVKRIFRYLKGKPKLGLWYPRVSSFDLEAYSDSDYARANLDRKSTTGGCQFLGRRLISWQCKKQTIMATSTTEAEYVAAANCCGQVLWIQNQMLDYGFNFMNTKIYIDNESTICIVKNPVFHSKTKHIEIRHHFIRDAYEKKLIQVLKIHTDDNVADLLTKAFDVTRFNFLIVSIGMLNL
ncbi:putative ribonuclease H-like domain-containing protein [Tanacetum coccineum]|uniref:Ribonuclease H-like domain-containing protein n=1 Tax=Tanacetum coccineum TaxID=301880 RepID=A0ABQ4XJZ1_9ASTR